LLRNATVKKNGKHLPEAMYSTYPDSPAGTITDQITNYSMLDSVTHVLEVAAKDAIRAAEGIPAASAAASGHAYVPRKRA
jgi:hypothetical protein